MPVGPPRLLLALGLLLPPVAAAQESGVPIQAVSLDTGSAGQPAPLSVTPGYDAARYLSARESWSLTLSRPLLPAEGRLAVFIGHTDVTALTSVHGGRIVYRAAGVGIPAGETELVVYQTGAEVWRELARLPIRLLTAGGFERAALIPKADLISDGQIAQGRSPDTGEESRGLYQDVTANLGFDGSAARGGWAVKSRASAVGVSRDEQRLRFGQDGLDAPPVDLSDYLLELGRGPATLSLGHTGFGANRHLVNGFTSRGLTAGLKLGPAAQLGLAALNGSAPVGWSNPFGLSRSDHRIWSAALGVELVPARPGAVHLDATVMDGSVLPIAGYTQGVVNDAEESRGVGVQLAASDARQRVRLAAGLSRSRFVNPADTLLAQGTGLVAVRPESRTARYLEGTLQLLQSRPLSKSVAASLSAGFRHERVDPLYRSVSAQPRADWQQNAVETTAGLGTLSVQYSHGWSRDNLAGVRSILTSRFRDDALTAAIPLGSLLRASATAWWWPQLAVTYQVNRQHGDGVPENGGFSASHVPDQLNRNANLSLAWQRSRWSLGYRHNVVRQDNRQPGRELADFRSWVHAVTLGFTPSPAVTLAVDLSDERQRNLEFTTLQRTRRVGFTGAWRPLPATSLQGFVSLSRADDEPRTQDNEAAELRLEASQGFNLYRRPESGTQARVFLRYGRSRSAVEVRLAQPVPPQIQWSLATGMSLRLY
jgi:hypothetical protein